MVRKMVTTRTKYRNKHFNNKASINICVQTMKRRKFSGANRKHPHPPIKRVNSVVVITFSILAFCWTCQTLYRAETEINKFDVFHFDIDSPSFLSLWVVDSGPAFKQSPKNKTIVTPEQVPVPVHAPALVDDVDETGHDIKRLEKPLPFLAVKVPSPIFCLTLPRGGSTTVHRYFDCGLGVGASAHNRYPYVKSKVLKHVGDTMRENIEKGKPLLTVQKKFNNVKDSDSIDTYKIYSDYDRSVFSMIDSLDNISTFYPNSTILYVRRNATDWFQSASNHGSLLRRLRSPEKSKLYRSLFSPNPPKFSLTNESYWTEFYDNYSAYVKKFTSEKKSLTYVEIPLDSNAGSVMEKQFGIPKECWGRANEGEWRITKNQDNDNSSFESNVAVTNKGSKRSGPIAHPRYWKADR